MALMFIKNGYKIMFIWSSNSEPEQAISASKYFVVFNRQNNRIPNIVIQSQ